MERVLPGLRERGWAPNAWFPYQGPLQAQIEPLVDRSRFRQGSFAFSVRGWLSEPGLRKRAAGLPSYFRALRSMLAELEPDVVHANTLLVLPEATLAHRMGFPVVMHMHELPPPGRKTDLTLRWVASTADVVVTVSNAVSELFAPHAGATPFVRVYNGLPPEAFDDPRGPRTSDRLIVGTVGGMTSRKGADVFLDAAREVISHDPDVDFLHVGPPPWETPFAAEIDAKLATLPSGRVTIAGVQPAAALLRTMDVFVMASRQEPFALASLEAMAVGIPVIVTDVGGLREQIEHLKSGIVVPANDPGAIAQWIRRLRGDPSLRAELGAAARRRAAERFGIEQQCDGLDAAYCAAMGHRASEVR